MAARIIKSVAVRHLSESAWEDIQTLYKANGSDIIDMDESDLIILTLMGAQFDYSTLVFESNSVGLAD